MGFVALVPRACQETDAHLEWRYGLGFISELSPFCVVCMRSVIQRFSLPQVGMPKRKLGADNPVGAFLCNAKKCTKLDLTEAIAVNDALPRDSVFPIADADTMQSLSNSFLSSSSL